MKELLPIQTDVPGCFGCGQENPLGMKLRFTKEDDQTVSTHFTPPKDWTGWANLLHGGFHALLLDEAMAWAAWTLADVTGFVTTKLEIRYLKPAYVEQTIIAYGSIVEDRGKEILVRGWLTDADGQTLTEGLATIRRITLEKLQSLIKK